jgi:hypothetical protein
MNAYIDSSEILMSVLMAPTIVTLWLLVTTYLVLLPVLALQGILVMERLAQVMKTMLLLVYLLAGDHCNTPIALYGSCSPNAICEPLFPGIKCTCKPGKVFV